MGDALVFLIFLAPVLVLIWALVRYAGRIRREAIDKDIRTQHLDHLSPALVRFVLERDRHTCQRCGVTERVGVDFTGDTPAEGQEITPANLEACCASCYLEQWSSLGETQSDSDTGGGILPRIW